MKTYILSIAVANYRSFEKLQNPINDSQALIGILENRYQIAESIFLHDEEVSPSAIEQAMRNLNDKIEEDDTLIIVFNGHGKSQEGSNAFYGLLSNSDENNTSTWYDTSRLFNLLLELENIKNMQYIAVIVNACEAGMLFTLPYITNNSADGNSKARLLITAGRGRSTVSDSTITSPNNSPFVAEVVQFLKDNSEEKLSLSKALRVLTASKQTGLFFSFSTTVSIDEILTDLVNWSSIACLIRIKAGEFSFSSKDS